MSTIKLVIKLSEEMYKNIQSKSTEVQAEGYTVENAILNGTPLPKGHGDLFDKAEILRFLKCPKYETCDWKNCFDCNESRCINLNNVNELVPIIKADKEESEEV